MNRTLLVTLTTALLGAACGSENTKNDDDRSYDQALLAQYRAALPKQEALTAATPQSTAASRAYGEPALYPTESYPLALAVNGSVHWIVTTMETITSLPPTFFNSETQEFVWGPYPHDSGVGYVSAYIKKEQPGADFTYSYALLRGIGQDLATVTPVIWGGATPLPDDQGMGVTLWDFEADNAFREAHDPQYDPDTVSHGRFVTLYGRGPDESAPQNMFAFVIAVFRNFVPEDKPGSEPVDLDYFYGKYQTPEHTVDFLDFAAGIDVSDPSDGVAEDIQVRMAFLDSGRGRAEASGSGGSLPTGDVIDVVECWDEAVDQVYIRFQHTPAGGAPTGADEGNASECGPIFGHTLDELNLPSRADIDAELMTALGDVAENGLPQ